MVIPKENNRGDKAEEGGSLQSMLENKRYTFSSKIIKKFMSTSEYESFCKNYSSHRGYLRNPGLPVSQEQKEAVKSFIEGKMSANDLQAILQTKTREQMYRKIGRIACL